MIKYNNNFNSDKILYPNVYTNLILKIINEYNKIYIYSPNLHQDLYQNLIKCFSNYIPIKIITNNLNEHDIDVDIEKIVINEDFEKSDTEIETYESMEELKLPQEYIYGGIIILDDLKEKEMIDPRVQAMFKRYRLNNLSIFLIGQDCHELPKKAIRSNGNIYHIFKSNYFLDVRNIYQVKQVWICQ